MRASCIGQVGPKPNDRRPERGQTHRRGRGRGGSDRVRSPAARAPRDLGGAGRTPSGERGPATPGFWTSGLQGREGRSVCCPKLPSWLSFAAPGA